MCAGAAGGAAGAIAGSPLDVARVRQQQAGAPRTSVLGGLRALVRREGALALFRGLSAPVLTCAIQNGVTFQAYGLACRYLLQQRAAPAVQGASAAPEATKSQVVAGHSVHAGPAGTLSVHESDSGTVTASDRGGTQQALPPSLAAVYAAGAVAGGVQCIVTVPQELLKIRLQLQTARPGAAGYRGAVATAAGLLRAGGPLAAFRGMGVTLLRDVPSYGLYFAIYEVRRSARAAYDKTPPPATCGTRCDAPLRYKF